MSGGQTTCTGRPPARKARQDIQILSSRTTKSTYLRLHQAWPPGSEDPLGNTRQRGVLPRAGSHRHLKREERDQVSGDGTLQDRAPTSAPHLEPPHRPRRGDPSLTQPDPRVLRPPRRPRPLGVRGHPGRTRSGAPHAPIPRGCARTLGPPRLRRKQRGLGLAEIHTRACARARWLMGARATY